MKNIHVIATDKPSRLKQEYTDKPSYVLSRLPLTWRYAQNIYITSDEEPKEGDWLYYENGDLKGIHKIIVVNGQRPKTMIIRKIILTTDVDLIAGGVQGIEDSFLEWFLNNPSCEEVEVTKGKMKLNDDGEEYGFPDMSLYKIIIPKEESKQETLEQVAANLADPNICKTDNWIAGAKWQQERMYSEKIELINWLQSLTAKKFYSSDAEDLLEQFKKKEL